jgi:hypothetical protein
MKPRQWMQIAAVASAMGLTGAAFAHDMDRTSRSGGDASATANSAAQLGGSTANPTPDAAQLGGSAANPTTGALPDNGLNDSIGMTPTLNDSTLDNGVNGSTLDGRAMDHQHAAPARTGSDVQPGDMGPGNSRGE